jgi:hypothetical protein
VQSSTSEYKAPDDPATKWRSPGFADDDEYEYDFLNPADETINQIRGAKTWLSRSDSTELAEVFALPGNTREAVLDLGLFLGLAKRPKEL